MKFDHYKKLVNSTLDILLGFLAIVVVIFMLRYILDIGSLILQPLSTALFGKVMVLAGVLTVFSFVSGDFKQSQDGKNVDIDQHF